MPSSFRNLGELLLFAAGVIFGACASGGWVAFVERLGLASIPLVPSPPAAPPIAGIRLRLFLARVRSSGGDLVPLI